MLRSAFLAPRVAVTAIALLLLALAGGGCSTVSVHSEAAPDVDFSRYHTFAQAPAPKSAGMSLPGYSAIAGDHIQAAIAHELEAKGLSPAPASEADLIVAFSIDGQQRQDIESTGGIGWYEGWGGDTYTVDYTRGTLIVDVFDAKKKKLVWHAYGQTDLYGSEDHTREVDSAVQSILKEFPPTP